jgi:hypothetical protein
MPKDSKKTRTPLPSNVISLAKEKAMHDYNFIGKGILTGQIEKNGEVILKTALQNIGRDEEQALIFHAWPNLERASIKLCALISDKYPGKNRPLVEEILDSAFEAYAQSVKERESETKRMARFLQALSVSADKILSICAFHINDRGEPISWPYFEESISSWAKKEDAAEIYFSHGPDLPSDAIVGGRTHLNAKIMTYTDIGKLSIFAYPDSTRAVTI